MTPKFVVSPSMGVAGAPGVEELRTDMLLLTRLAGLPLGPGPRAVDEALNGLISQKMKTMRFKGDLGQYILFDLDPRVHGDRLQRYVLLAGIGSTSKFNARAACQVFGLVLDKALEEGVSRLTIPIARNRMTVGNLNLKGMAHILKEVVDDKRSRVTRPALREIELFCTPQARKFIEEGLSIPSRQNRECCDASAQ
jgi:hypothetical protein